MCKSVFPFSNKSFNYIKKMLKLFRTQGVSLKAEKTNSLSINGNFYFRLNGLA